MHPPGIFSMPCTNLNVTGEEYNNPDGNISRPDAHQHLSQVLNAHSNLTPQVTRQCPTNGYYASAHPYNNASDSTGFPGAQLTIPPYTYTPAVANPPNPLDLPHQIIPPAPTGPTAANVPTPDILPVLRNVATFTCAWENCTMRIERKNSSDEAFGGRVEEHLKTHESTFKRAIDGRWHCKWVRCSKMYKHKKDLSRHLESCMNEVHPFGLKYKCGDCGDHLTRKDSWKRHMLAHRSGSGNGSGGSGDGMGAAGSG